MRKKFVFGIMLLVSFWAKTCLTQTTPTTPPPPGEPVKDPNSAPSQAKLSLEELLQNLENRLTKLHTFQADMLFQQDQLLLDSRTIRHGNLVYAQDSNQVAFRVSFRDWAQIDLEEPPPQPPEPVNSNEDYIFDGKWLSIRNESRKTLRQVELSRTTLDPNQFRLGKGPFPLPFALKKADVLKEFQVKILSSEPNDPNNSYHLNLIPRKTNSPIQYKSCDLWISHKNLVPVQMRFMSPDNEITFVRWSAIKIDKPIAQKTFQVTVPKTGWSTEIIPLDNQNTNKPK